jgi:hypothetical protein
MTINSFKQAKPKPAGDRQRLIDWRLEFMTHLAQRLKDNSWNEIEEAKHDRYVRINGESYRAVSLADDSPLSKFANSGSCELATIRQHFNKTPAPKNEEWLEKKRERRLQSRIIQQALINNRNLLTGSIFGKALEDMFDELVFALDEVSFGDVRHRPLEEDRNNSRCDLVAIGRIGSEVFPVVIELKSERSLDRLLVQLDDASNEILDHLPQFSSLLNALTGMSVSKAVVRKILVWPALVSGRPDRKETVDICEKREKAGMLFVEYSPNKFSSPKDISFSLRTY